jgi:hypothetical protein
MASFNLGKQVKPTYIIMSIGSCWLFGFVLCIVIAACMNPAPSVVLTSPFGQPMA